MVDPNALHSIFYFFLWLMAFCGCSSFWAEIFAATQWTLMWRMSSTIKTTKQSMASDFFIIIIGNGVWVMKIFLHTKFNYTSNNGLYSVGFCGLCSVGWAEYFWKRFFWKESWRILNCLEPISNSFRIQSLSSVCWSFGSVPGNALLKYPRNCSPWAQSIYSICFVLFFIWYSSVAHLPMCKANASFYRPEWLMFVKKLHNNKSEVFLSLKAI